MAVIQKSDPHFLICKSDMKDSTKMWRS